MSSPADNLREKRVELILQQLDELPTLPAIALRVLEATSSDDSSAAEVVTLISTDAALTARILQLVRRADLGVRGEVNSVERAVVLLGFEAVRGAVLALSVFQTLQSSPAASAQFQREQFWKHSIAVACCTELLAEIPAAAGAQAINPSEAFVCGLLHDLGKIAFAAVLPKSFDRVVEAADLLRGDIADLERSVIGLDHMVVGKRLAERWQLPLSIREVTWLHGQNPAALPSNVKHARLVNLVTLADAIVREQHLGYSGNYSFPIANNLLLQAGGVSAEEVEQVRGRLVEEIEPRAQALGLGETSTSELYQQALTSANKELGRVTNQLAAKNRKLAVRSKYFDALSGFQAELRPEAPPQAVLQAIGQTAVGALDVRCAAAFSLMPGQNFAEALLFDESGEIFETTLIDCAQRPEASPTGDGPVLRAGNEMEWLVAAISPRLANGERFWICLEADGMCIGGVVWGAHRGEAERLSAQVRELSAIAAGWSLALRAAQIREESRTLAEQLAEANRQLQGAQAELTRSRCIASVGEMAAGAAHEMNNPLAIISGRSQLLSSQLSDPKQKHAASLIHDQSHRISEIITELMEFAKPSPPKPCDADLAELIDRALYEAKTQDDPADRTIEVTMGDVPYVRVDPDQLVAALVEMIGNAIQATDEQRGHIAIHAAFEAVSNRALVTIADNGCGMDDETVRRAFDPFFSCRPAGRRRGMGLAKG
ncbi:MAG TPA: HDOD domain-containing protein, partial [Tepidisphaeraceae bacterium]